MTNAENHNHTDMGCPQEDRLETEDNAGAQSGASPQWTEESGAGSLLAQVLDRENLNSAYKRVWSNKGTPGVDGMTVEELLPYMKTHGNELIVSVSLDVYKPQPVKRVEIPKVDGGTRMLGVPTVSDRMIQQAIAQVLTPIFEPTFSDSSYGFRPNRNAHQAIRQAREYHDAGYKYVVDIDLEKYFDTVNHDLLINKLREQVRDEHLIALIRKYLKSGMMQNGLTSPTETGTPQGGNLSPLLSNIYLTAFDRMLEGRGHKFVRYADDCNIYVKSRRAAERVMASCTKYLEGKLKLRVNQAKSSVGSPLKLKFLGFSLYRGRNGTRIRVHSKSISRLKSKLKQITRRNRGVSVDAILMRLKRYARGWLGYFSIADMKNMMRDVTEWLRRRIRMYIWKQLKRIRTRFARLQEFGATKQKAWEWANTRKGYWRVAGSWILSTTLTNDRLAKLGFYDLSKHYEALHSNYRTAVYGSVRTVV